MSVVATGAEVQSGEVGCGWSSQVKDVLCAFSLIVTNLHTSSSSPQHTPLGAEYNANFPGQEVESQRG